MVQSENANSPLSEEHIEEKLKFRNVIKNGANWFYWIAGMSLLNTVIFIFGGNISFVTGLSVTQIIDAIAYGISLEMPSSFTNIVRIVSVVLDILIAGGFVVFGYFANKRYTWSFFTGMILYGLDALISLYFQDYLSLAFHLFALFGILNGLKANKKLTVLENSISPRDIS